MAIKGADFIFRVKKGDNYIVVCYATDCQINRTFETREISGPQGKDRDYISDYRGYTISIPFLVVYTEAYNYIDFSNAAEAGEKLEWAASAFENGGVVYSGSVLVTELDLSSQMRDVMKVDCTLQGCGEFKTDYVPVDTTVYLSDFNKVQLAGCPNPYPVSVFWYDLSLIGLADNPDDVISIFNDYSLANGGYYILTSSVDGGCLFNMQIQYNAPQPWPTTVFAQPGAEFALSDNQTINNALSPDQDLDQALTPIA